MPSRRQTRRTFEPGGGEVIPSRVVSTMQMSSWFGVPWSPFALLDEDMVIRAANSALCDATGIRVDTVLDRPAFEVFPEPPGDPAAAATRATLLQSTEDVLRTARTAWLGCHRHDVPRPGGGYQFRIWFTVQIPVTVAGHPVGVLHHVQDVSRMSASARRGRRNSAAPLPDLRLSEDLLRREFPHARPELVLGILTHSHRFVLDTLRVPDPVSAVELARLRLEIRTRVPADRPAPSAPAQPTK